MNLHVTASPHVHSELTTARIMRDVLIALAPAALWAVVAFGANALLLMAVSVLAAVGTEYAVQRLTHRPVTVNDLSAAVTGLLVAMNVPASAPWWLVVVGSFFAIAIVKQCFGGLGHNFMNPALAARAMLLACWPSRMSGSAFTAPTFWSGVDAVSSATPLDLLKKGLVGDLPDVGSLLLGNIGDCLGEVSAVCLLLGLAYLLIRRVISWRIPVIYVATVAVMTFLFGGLDVMRTGVHLLSGGLLLGAIFMATDYTTSPLTAAGQVIFAVGCGVLTATIRLWGGYPEGVSYSILLMNVATPLIDRWVKPHVFGVERRRGKHA